MIMTTNKVEKNSISGADFMAQKNFSILEHFHVKYNRKVMSLKFIRHNIFGVKPINCHP